MRKVIRSQRPIYVLITKYLEAAEGCPRTVTDLMENQAIREEALRTYDPVTGSLQVAANKLSDALGLMSRQGVVRKCAATPTATSRARFAYFVSSNDDHGENSAGLPPRHTSEQAAAVAKPIIRLNDTGDRIDIELRGVLVSLRT